MGELRQQRSNNASSNVATAQELEMAPSAVQAHTTRAIPRIAFEEYLAAGAAVKALLRRVRLVVLVIALGRLEHTENGQLSGISDMITTANLLRRLFRGGIDIHRL